MFIHVSDSELDSFHLHNNYDVASGTFLAFLLAVSREVCAQACTADASCTGFVYVSDTIGDPPAANCTLYAGGIILDGPHTKYPEVYLRKFSKYQRLRSWR